MTDNPKVKEMIPEEEVSDASESSRLGVYVFSLSVFAASFLIVLAATYFLIGPFSILAALVVGALLSYSIRIAEQWERVIILRFGKFNRITGPGVYVVFPFVEYVAARIDQRIRIMSFSAEAALTRDLVPVDIDAVIFWMVWDAEKACLEVEDYPRAVLWSAQSAMRDAIGQLELADISPRRKQINRDLEDLLGAKCEQWGVTVASVEIRDITVPDDLQEKLSREAQAQSERNARMVLFESEKDIAEMLSEAAKTYEQSPVAFELYSMKAAQESAKEGRGIMIAPSSLADGFCPKSSDKK